RTGKVFQVAEHRSTRSLWFLAHGAAAPKLRWYQEGSFEAHRTGRSLVTDLFENCELFIFQLSLSANVCQERTQLHSSLGTDYRLQNFADFGLHALTMLRGPQAQRTMHFIGDITYSQHCHLHSLVTQSTHALYSFECR